LAIPAKMEQRVKVVNQVPLVYLASKDHRESLVSLALRVKQGLQAMEFQDCLARRDCLAFPANLGVKVSYWY
jgi:hypothetical protein